MQTSSAKQGNTRRSLCALLCGLCLNEYVAAVPTGSVDQESTLVSTGATHT